MKKVKVKNENKLITDMVDAIYNNTNACISLEMRRMIKKFIEELKKCYFQP